MPLSRPFPVDKAWPNAIDLRKQNSAIYPREGLFPDPITIATAGVAYGNGGWNVGARPFVANIKRGGAPFTQAYGSLQVSNDSAATAWTIAAAPASGSRIDRLWIRATDPSQGEALTTPSGETVARAVPIFGVTTGTASGSPVAPALPAGVEEIAQVTTPSSATSIAQSTIVQTYAFANVVGGTLYARTVAERNALTGMAIGEECHVIATGSLSYYDGTRWRTRSGGLIAIYDFPWSGYVGNYGFSGSGGTTAQLDSFLQPDPGEPYRAEIVGNFEGGSSASGTRVDFDFGYGGTGDDAVTNSVANILFVGEETIRFKIFSSARTTETLTGARTWRTVARRIYGSAAGNIGSARRAQLRLFAP